MLFKMSFVKEKKGVDIGEKLMQTLTIRFLCVNSTLLILRVLPTKQMQECRLNASELMSLYTPI